MKVLLSRVLSVAVAATAAAGFLFAQGGGQPVPGRSAERKTVFLKADRTYSLKVGDSTAMCMVGNFAALHNGTVITCDSAIRYSATHLECFGNVLINKNTTYVYGDRAEYLGDVNRAEVFSPLVKVVDGDATLYTYRFVFDTKNSVGEFADGGVLTNGDNLLESTRGYYYTDTHQIVCVGEVEMRNDDYQLTGDSVAYNIDTDHAEYYRNTNIWNRQGDYLYADRGTFEKAEELYSLTLNGYILTDKQELWSDSLDYYRPEEHVVLKGNIQLDDTEYKTLAFGEYGEYWKYPGNALLTVRPSMVGYDTKQQADSLFMRADTIYFYTVITTQQPEAEVPAVDSLAADRGSLDRGMQPPAADSLAVPSLDTLASPAADALRAAASDSTAVAGALLPGAGETSSVQDAPSGDENVETAPDAAAEPELTPAEKKARLREIAEKERAEKKAKAAAERKARLEQIAVQRQERATAKLLQQKTRDSISLAKRRIKARARLEKRRGKAALKGWEMPDSSEIRRLDSLMRESIDALDSLGAVLSGPREEDSLALVPFRDTTDSLSGDTIHRFIRAYRQVKIYRTDFQAVCDSLVGVGADSTLHLYIDPVLWNENNQITSDVMDIFTENGQLVRGEFIGHPIMIAQLDTAYYNQVSGKTMTAFFRNNEIYRNDVYINVQTFYFLQEEGGPRVVDMLSITSGDASFYIEQKQIVGITYRNNPVFSMSPLERLPDGQDFFLQDFKWEGSRRPDRDEVFDRTIRPSLREQKSRLPHPQFPIRDRIDAYRLQLMETGRWSDRDEEVSPAVREWMETREE